MELNEKTTFLITFFNYQYAIMLLGNIKKRVS